jgi:hypothetical protein
LRQSRDRVAGVASLGVQLVVWCEALFRGKPARKEVFRRRKVSHGGRASVEEGCT